MSKEQPWCKSVEKHLTKRYPTASVEDPRPINVHLRTGIDVRIESSWYDVLVLEEPCSKRVLDGNTTGVHCFEVKYSGKGKRSSFGAFTIGEWLAAKLACNKASTRMRYCMYGNLAIVDLRRLRVFQLRSGY